MREGWAGASEPPGRAAEAHISSLVVHCRLDEAERVITALRAMPDAEISVAAPGKLVVVLETPSEGEIVDRLNHIQRLSGVLAATLVFHHHEPALAGEPVSGE
ncbi:chaperone NapD [Sabulicella glaciei]|uniref:Chaperone NapD n=1 Tax=Sabulicella glaciei TaxID=2984948 RepID=A0ABT3NQT8_9PROT|nr:chaperone NapD [Roseococcus sp. MDT2-1-1]MCW8084248.1 chaperone NapD [Roseococcus sp. MDT2-1-1]